MQMAARFILRPHLLFQWQTAYTVCVRALQRLWPCFRNQKDSVMFHILLLIVSLAGQPVGIAKAPGDVAYTTEAACAADRQQALEVAQKMIDDNPTVRGQFKVARAKCFSDSEIEELQH